MVAVSLFVELLRVPDAVGDGGPPGLIVPGGFAAGTAEAGLLRWAVNALHSGGPVQGCLLLAERAADEKVALVAAGELGGDAVAGDGRRRQTQLPGFRLAGEALAGQIDAGPGRTLQAGHAVQLVTLVEGEVGDGNGHELRAAAGAVAVELSGADPQVTRGAGGRAPCFAATGYGGRAR